MRVLARLFAVFVLCAPTVVVAVAQDGDGDGDGDDAAARKKAEEAAKLEKENRRVERRRELKKAFNSAERIVVDRVEAFALMHIRDWERGLESVISEPPEALLNPMRYYLIDEDWEVKAFAAFVIGEALLEELLPELEGAYDEARHAITRRKAVEAAARIAKRKKVAESRALFEKGITDEEPGVRMLAVTGFEWLADRDALLRVLQDPDPDTRYRAIGALARLGDKGAQKQLLRDFMAFAGSTDLRRRASLETRDVGERYSQFLNALAIGYWGGPEGIKLLSTALMREGDYRNKLFLSIGSAAALGKGRPADPAAEVARMRAIRDAIGAGDGTVRAMGAFAAGFAGDPSLVRLLTRVLGDAQIDVRANAVEALGRIPGRGAVVQLASVVKKERDTGVRLVAVRGLARHPGPEAVAALARAVKDKRYMVRVAAARMLGRRGPEAASAARALIKATRDPDYGVREVAVVALARTGVPEGVEPIGNALKDRDERVRIRALRALARHPHRELVRENKAILERCVYLLVSAQRIEQRKAARECLIRVRAPIAVPFLIRELEAKQYSRRRAAFTVLRDYNRNRSLEYSAQGTPSERKKAVRNWKGWWKEGGAISPPPPPPTKRANQDLPVFHRYARDLRWRGIDLVLVYDSTGSMIPVIRAVKQRLDLLIEESSRLVPNLRLSLFTYRDEGEEYVYYGTPLTYATENLKAFVQVAEANRGGDLPEAITDTVTAAIDKLAWRKDAQKVIVVIGDAPFHPEREAELFRKVREFNRGSNHGVVHAIFTDPNRLGESIQARRVRAESGTTFPFLDRLGEMARAGGGRAISIQDTEMLITEILVLSFGEKWRTELESRLDFD